MLKPNLEFLWSEGVMPSQTCGVGDPQIEELVILLDRNRSALEPGFSETQKKMFEAYADCADEFAYLLSAHAFSDGFSLAVRLLTEALIK